MAKSFNEITITAERRLCVVKDRVGYFHGWEHYSDVFAPSLLKGGHPGGTVARTYGLVEFTLPECNNEATGVERVSPTDIVFLDDETAKTLRWYQEYFDNEIKWAGGDAVESERREKAGESRALEDALEENGIEVPEPERDTECWEYTPPLWL